MSPFFHTGLAPLNAQDGKSYTSILYGNGPGYVLDLGVRPNVTEVESGKYHNIAYLEVLAEETRADGHCSPKTPCLPR